jgi:pimeloyl-ACP methyl ester carboxylesterase
MARATRSKRRCSARGVEERQYEDGVLRDDEGRILRETARVGSAVFDMVRRTLRNEQRVPGADAGPPGRPFEGYGSRERYIARRVTETGLGSAVEGTRVWCFVPDKLRDGKRAPIIVYLHGFRASAPNLYWEHIHHLTAQGYVVLFPRIQKGGVIGLFNDNDQREMVERAISATQNGLRQVADIVDLDQLYVFGHSLGGLIGACWNGAGAPAACGLVLAHPSITTDQIPEFARRFITCVEWDGLSAANSAPVILLGGDQDKLAPPHETLALGAAMTSAASVATYIARADDHGVPAFRTGHMATVRSDSGALRWMGQALGGNQAQDTLQSRFYHASLDAMLAGDFTPALDFGNWSDGVAVSAPLVETRAPTKPKRRTRSRASKRKPK